MNGTLQASYELDLFGKLASTTAAARADLHSQQTLAGSTALSVAASTASGYLNLRRLDAQLALAKRQFEVGYSSRLDWAQAQAGYHATAAVVPQLERAIVQPGKRALRAGRRQSRRGRAPGRGRRGVAVARQPAGGPCRSLSGARRGMEYNIALTSRLFS